MMKIIESLKGFITGEDLAKQAGARAAKRRAEVEAEEAGRLQQEAEALKSFASFTGRLVLVANFGNMPVNSDELFAEELAGLMRKYVFAPDKLLGVSAHASQHRRGIGGGDVSFDHAAGLLAADLAKEGFQIVRTEGPEFGFGLGVTSISAAVNETMAHYDGPPERIGHVAVVSALAMHEVGIDAGSGRGYVLEEARETKHGSEFTWRKLDPSKAEILIERRNQQGT